MIRTYIVRVIFDPLSSNWILLLHTICLLHIIFGTMRSGGFLKTVYDVRMLLKRFGTFIYSGDRIGDLLLMESELEELFKLKFISNQDYTLGKLILQEEKRRLKK